MDFTFAFRGVGDARQQLEQSTLSGPVSPNHSQNLALAHFKGHVAQSPNRAGGTLATTSDALETFHNVIPQGTVLGLHHPNPVLFSKIINFDGNIAHTISANVFSIRRK
jgi:hypothetical protein